MFKKLILVVSFIFIFLGFGKLIQPDQEKKENNTVDKRIWIGSITIKKEGGAEKSEKPKPRESCTGYSKLQHTLEETVTIKACGKAGGELCVTGVECSHEENYLKKSFYQQKSTQCPPTEEQKKDGYSGWSIYAKKNPPKKPGDIHSTEVKWSRDIYREEDRPDLKTQALVQLWVFPDGQYTLSAISNFYLNYSYHAYDEWQYVCSSKIARTETIINTGKIGQEGKAQRVRVGGDKYKGDVTYYESTNPPIPSILGCTVKGNRDWNTISTEARIVAHDPEEYKGDFHSDTTASWNFVYKEPANYRSDCLNESLKVLEVLIRSFFVKLNIKVGKGKITSLLDCVGIKFSPPISGEGNGNSLHVIPLDLPEMTEPRIRCIEFFCGRETFKKLTEEQQTELIDKISKSLMDFQNQILECQQDYEHMIKFCQDEVK